MRHEQQRGRTARRPDERLAFRATSSNKPWSATNLWMASGAMDVPWTSNRQSKALFRPLGQNEQLRSRFHVLRINELGYFRSVVQRRFMCPPGPYGV